MKFLVIEDSLDDQVFYRYYFNKMGLKVKLEFATLGEEGFLKLEQEAFDKVLLDAHLPDYGAKDWLSALKTKVPQFQGSVIVISGYEDKDFAKEILNSGAKEFFLKKDLFQAALEDRSDAQFFELTR